MIRVCTSIFHKGDRVFGEKSPLEDKSLTHGICPECFPLEMEKIEKELEQLEVTKNPKRRCKMPKERQPKGGDLVLFDDDIWIIKNISVKGLATIENFSTGDIEKLLCLNMEETSIRTWEVN